MNKRDKFMRRLGFIPWSYFMDAGGKNLKWYERPFYYVAVDILLQIMKENKRKRDEIMNSVCRKQCSCEDKKSDLRRLM